MNVKTMEGLAGASASIQMMSTPMSVAKEAERKGETDKMQRALGYAAGLAEQADQYSEKTGQGMKLDAREAKEKEKKREEELIQARKEEREQLEEQTSFDTAQISEEGKIQAAHKETASETEEPVSSESMGEAVDLDYSQLGEAVEPGPEKGENVDVRV